jgi:hypothetical protein
MQYFCSLRKIFLFSSETENFDDRKFFSEGTAIERPFIPSVSNVANIFFHILYFSVEARGIPGNSRRHFFRHGHGHRNLYVPRSPKCYFYKASLTLGPILTSDQNKR